MSEFENKVALVTGANGGIGQAVTRMLRERGATVVVTDRQLDGINADLAIEGDLTDAHFAKTLPQKAYDAFGRLDIVINNAGLMRRGSVLETNDEDFDISVAVNVKAPYQICQAAIPLLAEQGGGAIVNTASCWGLRAGPDHAVYCMTKAAIASLTQCMARDHAKQGIRINAVCPNEVDTPMLRTGFERRGFDPASAIAALGETVPIGHVASPDEIAEVILFLASEKAGYLVGSLVEVNGGKQVA